MVQWGTQRSQFNAYASIVSYDYIKNNVITKKKTFKIKKKKQQKCVYKKAMIVIGTRHLCLDPIPHAYSSYEGFYFEV